MIVQVHLRLVLDLDFDVIDFGSYYRCMLMAVAIDADFPKVALTDADY